MKRKLTTTGLDIGSTSIRAIEMKHSGDTVAITKIVETARPSSDDGLAETLDAFFTEHKLSRANVRTALQGNNVISRYIAMPRLTDDKIQGAVLAEADKYIPFDIQDVIFDCHRVGPDNPDISEMQVLLVAIKRTIIEEWVHILNAAKLKPDIIDCADIALGNAFAWLCPEPDRSISRVDMGATATSVSILAGEDILFSREISAGGNAITEAISDAFDRSQEESETIKCDPGENQEVIDTVVGPVLEQIGQEIKLCLDFYENQYNETVDTLAISGGSALYQNFDSLLGSALERTAYIWNPLLDKKLTLPSDIDQNFIQTQGTRFCLALGLAARGKA
jgi:type IV pilus assembly protein PilM